MKTILRHLAILLVLCLLTAGVAMASSVQKYIKDLKSEEPKIRAKAAYELGCT